MVHIKNLPGIFKAGALFPLETLRVKKIKHLSIAYDDVQKLRDRVFVWDSIQQKYFNLHRYVPFYFAIRPPMLHSQHNKNNAEVLIPDRVSLQAIRRIAVYSDFMKEKVNQIMRSYGAVGIAPQVVVAPELFIA